MTTNNPARYRHRGSQRWILEKKWPPGGMNGREKLLTSLQTPSPVCSVSTFWRPIHEYLYLGYKIDISHSISLWPHSTDAGKFFQVSTLNSFCHNSVPFPTSPPSSDKYKTNTPMRSAPSSSSCCGFCLLLPHTSEISFMKQASYLPRHCPHPFSHSSAPAQSGKTKHFRGIFSVGKGGKTESWKLVASPSSSLLRWLFVWRLLPVLRGSPD